MSAMMSDDTYRGNYLSVPFFLAIFRQGNLDLAPCAKEFDQSIT